MTTPHLSCVSITWLRRLPAALAAVAVLTWATAFAAHAERRLALVVGNNAYASVSKLEKAVNDAQAVADTLKGLGFEVQLLTDGTRRALSAGIAEFESKIQPGDTALFFFAGHGVSVDGANYLLSVDVPSVSDTQKNRLKDEGILADDIAQRFKDAGAGATVLVLDACRNNPFRSAGGRSVGQSRGLTRMDARQGVFVMFSAGAGQVALDRLGPDDTDPNSVFTRHFVKLVKRADLSLIDVAKELQTEVPKLASSVSHDQLPAYYDQVQGRIYLAGREPPARPPVQTPTVSGSSEAATAFAQVRSIGSCGAYEAFVRRFPNTFEAMLAEDHLKNNCGKAAKPAETNIGAATAFINLHAGRPSCAEYQNFVMRYPTSPQALQATQYILKNCQKPGDLAANTAGDQGNARALPTTPVYRVRDNVSQGIQHMRAGAGTQHQIVVSIPAGTSGITVTQCRLGDDGRGRWCESKWQQFSGWIHSGGIVDAKTGQPPK